MLDVARPVEPMLDFAPYCRAPPTIIVSSGLPALRIFTSFPDSGSTTFGGGSPLRGGGGGRFMVRAILPGRGAWEKTKMPARI